MQIDSHRPDSTPPPMGPRGFLTALEIRPIIVGVVVDHVATIVFRFLYLLTYLPREAFEEGGASEEIIGKAVTEMMTAPDALFSLAMIGAICIALGGYIAGRMASREKVKHGALVGFASLLTGVLITTMAGEGIAVPDWYKVMAYLVPVPAGAIGGYFAEKRW